MMRARASDTAARANGTAADPCKPDGRGLWDLLWDQNGDDSRGKERSGWNQESQSPLKVAPNSAERHTPLISAVCTKEVLPGQTSFCNTDLKVLLNSITQDTLSAMKISATKSRKPSKSSIRRAAGRRLCGN